MATSENVMNLKQIWNIVEKEAQEANEKLANCRFCLEQLLRQKNVDSDIVRTVQEDFDEAHSHLILVTSKRDHILVKYDLEYVKLSNNINFFEQVEQEEEKHNAPRPAPAPHPSAPALRHSVPVQNTPLLQYEPFIPPPRPSAPPPRPRSSAPHPAHKQSAGRNVIYNKLTKQKKVFKK